ncbi:hypothetical protein [Pseudomonas sp. QD4]|uniref:hypothetical protein n=1 Tax=Pseudomonas sp. QD4 TaxID=3368618 RepID=UPI003BA2DCDD
MKILNTYDDGEEAEEAAKKMTGNVRVASERDAGETIYNLFGEPTWRNFYELGMYRLPELQVLLNSRVSWGLKESSKHREIISTLRVLEKNFDIKIPAHWL